MKLREAILMMDVRGESLGEGKTEQSLAMKVRSKLNFLAGSRLTDLGQCRSGRVGPTPSKRGTAEGHGGL